MMISHYIYIRIQIILCSYLQRSCLKCWNLVNLAMDGTAVVRHLSVFPNQCNFIYITCLGCPVP